MRKIFALLIFFTYSTLIAQIAWTPLNTGSLGELRNLVFLDQNTGFVISNIASSTTAKILKTTNAGNNWIELFSMTPGVFSSLQFINNTTGYIETSTNYLKTTNGGLNWITVSSTYEKPYYFLDTSNWYGGGLGGGKTTNSGVNWTALSVSEIYPTAYSFLNPRIGIMHGRYFNKVGNYGKSYFTTNGGANWLSTVYTSSSTPFMVGGIVDSSFFYTAGGYVVIKSTNSGLNWQRNELPSFPKIQSIQFVNRADGYLCCLSFDGINGLVFVTNDGGNSWISSPFVPAVPLYSIYFTSALTGFVCGKNGALFKTTTGGIVTGISQSNSEIADNFSLSQNYPNPFNPATVISYRLPAAGSVSLIVYDALGNEVSTLVNEKQNAGSYSVEFNAASLPSGIYFYKLVTEKFSETKKMVLVK